MNSIQKKYMIINTIISLAIMLSYMMFIVLNINYLCSIIAIFLIGGCLAIYLFKYPDSDHETSRNKSLMIFFQMTNIMILIGLITEFQHSGISNSNHMPFMIFTIYYIVVWLFLTLLLFVFTNFSNNKKLRHLILANYLFVYVVMVMTIDSFWVLFIGITLLNSYTIYGDKKLILRVCLAIHGLNFLAIIKHVISNGLINDKYSIMVYFMEFECLTIYSFILIYSSYLVKDMSDEKIELVNNEQQKIDSITKQIIKIVQKVKSGVITTDKVADELDNSMTSALHLINDIADGSSQNTVSIEEQASMSNNISAMIQDVVEASKDATKISNKSLEGVIKSKESFTDIKQKSSKIVENNKDVLETINEFVKHAKSVKNISNGIAHISDETNLLSFNASVKSAQAGKMDVVFLYLLVKYVI